ncbi:MAG: hypothetical protein SOW62_01865, partial [Sodaliphilus sp.]|nr:hypothetical protein [Sodaliphilus sp.]
YNAKIQKKSPTSKQSHKKLCVAIYAAMWVIRQCDLSAEVKPKSVIRPCMDFLDYFLRSFGFYMMPFACF